MRVVQGWLKTESAAVAKGLSWTGIPHWGCDLCADVLSPAVVTSASKVSENYSTVKKLHSELHSGSATSIQLFKRLEWSDKSFITQSTSRKRGLIRKSQPFSALTSKEETRAAVLNLAA